MRIGWVLYGALEQLTGGYVYDARVVLELRKQGDTVELLSLPDADLASPDRLLLDVLNGAFDLIVGDELCHLELDSLFDSLARLRAEGTKVPASVLLVHHLTAWESGKSRSTESRVVQAADRVIVTSEMSARRMALEFGVQAVVCVPGADRLPLLERCSDPTLDAPLELLFVGTWTERKGLLVLVQALGRLQRPSYRLRIAGDQARDPAYRSIVETEINSLPLVSARIEICGAVSDSTLAQLYSSADVLVLPSFFEGYGMVLCEALRAGLALVASDVGAVPEVAQAGKDARLVPAGNVEALAAVLDELITNRAEVRRLQANASQRTLEAWSAVGQCFRDVLVYTG